MRVPIAKFGTVNGKPEQLQNAEDANIANISGGATQYRGATAISRGFTGADCKSFQSLSVFIYAENTYMVAMLIIYSDQHSLQYYQWLHGGAADDEASRHAGTSPSYNEYMYQFIKKSVILQALYMFISLSTL